MQREAALHREPLERVREQRRREPADPIAGEARARSRRAAGARGRRPRSRAPRPSARSPSRSARPRSRVAERLRERVAERGEDVLDRVVLVDVEVAAGEQLEIEAGVEGAEREQVVEEADAGRDARASLRRRGRARAAARSRCSCA